MKIVSKIPTTYWLIGVLTLIGLVLRLINLDYLTLWVDEYIHAVPAKEWAEGRAYTPSENNGILLTYMISFFYKIFGVSDFWARFPSVLFGVGCIPLIYILGKRLFNDFVGVVSALLITVSLYHVYWSRIGRNYAIFVFFFLLMNILFLKAFESEEIKSKLSFFKKIKISPLYLRIWQFI